MDHVGSEQLELYALGRLADRDRDVVELHILECRHCQDELDLTGQLIGIVRQELTRPIARKRAGNQSS